MKRKGKFLLAMFAVALLVCAVCVAFAACNGNKESGGNTSDHTHVAGEWIEDRVATCEVKAHHHKICKECGETVEEEDYGELAPHTPEDEWTEDRVATCEVRAHHHKLCKVCGEMAVDEDYGELAEHEYVKTDAKAPTCTVDGNEEYFTCDECGKLFDSEKQVIEEIPVLPAAHDIVLDKWESDGTHHWHKCNNCDEKLDYAAHTPEWVEDSEATCTERATHHQKCSICDHHTESEEYGETLPHEWNEETDKCNVCGKNKPLYEEKGGKIYFGEYPQTKVEDNGIISTLNGMSGDRPVKGNSGKWTDYGYYIGINIMYGLVGTPDQQEYMWYIDLEYQETRYRGVYFTSYRPLFTWQGSSADNSYQDDCGYFINTLYWFKWEPIEWRVLENTGDELFLMANVILDAQAFQNECAYSNQKYYNSSNGVPSGTYACNYKYSTLRAWLNGTFYNQAFDELEQGVIKETFVDNSASTTSNSTNEFACENTYDKVFLLSYKDVLNTRYGFNSSDSDDDTARQLKTTDYAKSQGTSKNVTADWRLRSPYYSVGDRLLSVDGSGVTYTLSGVADTCTGVVPAIKIQL